MKSKLVLITGIILILTVLLAACGNNQSTTAPVENATTSETGTTTTQGPAATERSKNGVPEDVPIMPDAYELQVATELNLSYKVDATIQEVVDFYQAEFPNYGWDVINNPDTVVGSMAQMSRSNANGDRLIFSLQNNPIANFTSVTIYITRTP